MYGWLKATAAKENGKLTKVKHIDAKKTAGLNARLGEYAEADENDTFAFVEAQDDITVQQAKAGAVKVMPHLPRSKFHLAYGEEE